VVVVALAPLVVVVTPAARSPSASDAPALPRLSPACLSPRLNRIVAVLLMQRTVECPLLSLLSPLSSLFSFLSLLSPLSSLPWRGEGEGRGGEGPMRAREAAGQVSRVPRCLSPLVPIGIRPSGEWRYNTRHRILGHERPGWCYPTGRCTYLPSVTCSRQSIKPPPPPSSSSSSSTAGPVSYT